MKIIITAILIIVAVAAVLFILPFAIMLFSYIFGIEMDENGGTHECIGCPYRTCPDCENDCKTYKRYQKRLAREVDQYAKHELGLHYYIRCMDDIIILHHDKKYLAEVKGYLQEYAKKKQEKKNRKEGKR